jgi:hypothetical protein
MCIGNTVYVIFRKKLCVRWNTWKSALHMCIRCMHVHLTFAWFLDHICSIQFDYSLKLILYSYYEFSTLYVKSF